MKPKWIVSIALLVFVPLAAPSFSAGLVSINFDELSGDSYLEPNHYESLGVNFYSLNGGEAYIFDFGLHPSVYEDPNGGTFSLPNAIVGSVPASTGIEAIFTTDATHVHVGVSSGPGSDTLGSNVSLLAYDHLNNLVAVDNADSSAQFDVLSVNAPEIARVEILASDNLEAFDDFTFGTAAPIVEYLFNEGSGTTAMNSGSLGSSTDGMINEAIYSSDTPLGTGFSLEFDGINDFVWVEDNFNYTNQLTIEAWIKPDAVSDQRIIWDDYGNPGVVFAVWDGLVEFEISTQTHPGPGIGIYDGNVTTGEWQHVAGIYDGSEMKVYINGVHTGTIEYTSGNIIDNPGPPTYAAIGSSNVEADLLNFDGKIDDFRIFDVALDPSELADGFFANQPPDAEANVDQIVFDEVTLDGSQSFDPDGTIEYYEWNLEHRENSDYDRSANGVNPIVSDLEPGFYDVTLTVTDNEGAVNTDTMLLAASGPCNGWPQPNADFSLKNFKIATVKKWNYTTTNMFGNIELPPELNLADGDTVDSRITIELFDALPDGHLVVSDEATLTVRDGKHLFIIKK